MRPLIAICVLLCTSLVFGKPQPLGNPGEPYYDFVEHHVLVAFSKAAAPAKINDIIARSGGKVGSHSDLLDFYRIEVPGTAQEGVAFFRAQEDVLWANYNYIAQAHFVPNDQFYQYQWHYPLIGLEQAWDVTQGSPDVVVAVLDQGWKFDHEDYAGVQTVNPRDCVDSDNNPAEPTLEDSHGMHTAGTIFARTNNQTGVAGIAPLCRLMPIRVLNNDPPSGSGTTEWIANGFAWAAQNGADVLNASLGYGIQNNQPPADPGEPLTGAVQMCASAGVVMCVSSGNDGADYVAYPAAYPACISVGATALNNAIAPYSNRGTELDLTAPGGNTEEDLNGDTYVDGVLSSLWSQASGDYYAFWQGTSMAAPHVAGVAALVLSHGCPPSQVRNALQQTVLDLGVPGWDQVFGYGRVNALAAIQYDCEGGGGGETILFNGPMESNAEGWTVEENGNNGVGWRFLDFGAPDCGADPHGGQNGLWHDDEQGVGLLDDWLYTPQITIPANASVVAVSFWQRNCYVTPQYYDLHAFYYSTDGNNYTQVMELDDQAQSWEEVTVDATALAGNNVYFAWRYRGDYATEWFLDDVVVSAIIGSDVAPDADVTIPAEFTFGNPYPNPFNSVVQIPFAVAVPQALSLTIYNVMGQEVARLVNGERMEVGAHRVVWQADQAASGVYLLRLSNGERTLTQKILLVK